MYMFAYRKQQTIVSSCFSAGSWQLHKVSVYNATHTLQRSSRDNAFRWTADTATMIRTHCQVPTWQHKTFKDNVYHIPLRKTSIPPLRIASIHKLCWISFANPQFPLPGAHRHAIIPNPLRKTPNSPWQFLFAKRHQETLNQQTRVQNNAFEVEITRAHHPMYSNRVPKQTISITTQCQRAQRMFQ